jgi:hypothetical protein
MSVDAEYPTDRCAVCLSSTTRARAHDIVSDVGRAAARTGRRLWRVEVTPRSMRRRASSRGKQIGQWLTSGYQFERDVDPRSLAWRPAEHLLFFLS